MVNCYRIGVVVPSGGSPAMYAPGFFATAQLAAHEINVAGGVLGSDIELVQIRVGPNALHDPDELLAAIERARPQCLVLLHDSHVRELVISVVGGRLPIFYPPIWEGGAQQPGVICTGESPEVKVWPALAWLARNASACDWMIVGTDYRWPSGTARTIEPLLSRQGWWRGTHLVPYSLLDDLDGDERVVRQLIDAVEVSNASCVLVLLHGSQMAMFNREFAARGLDERVLRFAPMADEDVLLASGPETTRGLLTAFGALDGDAPDEGCRFMDRYAALHGTHFPAPTGVTLAGYEGIAVASAVAERAETLSLTARDLSRVRKEGFDFTSPTGRVRVQGYSVVRAMNLLFVEGIEFGHLAELSSAPR